MTPISPDTLTVNVAEQAAGHHVPPHGGKPESLPDGVFGRVPVQAAACP
jgi:hypothetical protein